MFPQAPAGGSAPANPFPQPAPSVHPSAQAPAAPAQLPQQQQFFQPQAPQAPAPQYNPAAPPAPVPSAGGFTPGPAPAFGQAPAPGVFTPPPPGTPITAAPPAPPPAPPVDTTQQQLAQVQAELNAAQQQLMANRAYIQLGQQAAAQRLQQNAQPQQASQQPQTNALGVVKFDPALLQFITTDANGNYAATPGAPPGTLELFMQNRAQTAHALRRIAEDPEGALGTIIEKRSREIANAELQKQLQEERRATEIRSVVSEISPWAFARDAQGQEIQQFNYVTQQYEPVLTPQGHAYNQALMMAENYGVQSARQRHDFAMRILQSQRPAQQAAPPAPQVPAYGNRTFGSPAGMQSQGYAPQTIAGIYQQQFQPTGVPTRVAQPMPQQQITSYPAPPAGAAPAARATLAQMMMQDLAAVRAGQQIAA